MSNNWDAGSPAAILPCKFCGLKLRTKEELAVHEGQHEPEKLGRLSRADRHMNDSCKFCGGLFKEWGQLAEHERVCEMNPRAHKGVLPPMQFDEIRIQRDVQTKTAETKSVTDAPKCIFCGQYLADGKCTFCRAATPGRVPNARVR